jgi:hypothetical protein
MTLIAVLALGLTGVANAASSWDALKNVPVQEGGRIKPFDTWAHDMLAEVYGKTSWEGNSATAVAVSMMVDGEAWKAKNVVKVEHLGLKERFGLERSRKYFSFDELVGNEELIRWVEELRQSGREDFSTWSGPAWTSTAARHRRHDDAAHVPHLYPGLRDAAQPWMSLGDMENMQGAPFVADVVQKWGAVEAAAMAGGTGLEEAVLAWTTSISGNAGWAEVPMRKIGIEVAYNAAGPFRKAWLLYVAAGIFFLAGWVFGKRILGFGAMFLLWGGFLVHTLGLLTRQYLAGRPPISNLYEALTFIVWGVVFMSILFEMSSRRRVHGTIAAVLGSIGLVLAETLPIERQLNPLVAVLRSYWMQYHVTIISVWRSRWRGAGALHPFAVVRAAPPELARKTSADHPR